MTLDDGASVWRPTKPDSLANQGVAPRRPMGFARLHNQGYEVSVGVDRLHVGDRYSIRFDEIRDVRVTDTSWTTTKRPTWAIVLTILLFPIGLLFLLAKDTVLRHRATITIYTATTAYPFVLDGRTTTDAYNQWYPLIAARPPGDTLR